MCPEECVFRSVLPVRYTNQTNACMDMKLFEEWFFQEFIPSVRNYLQEIKLPKKALLLIDIRYVTRKTYLFPQTRRIGFPRAAARQYADRQRGNARTLRGSIQYGIRR